MGELGLTQGLPQATLGRSHKSFEQASPPWSPRNIKFPLNANAIKVSLDFRTRNHSLDHFAAATNVLTLSDTIRAGKPLLELNLLKLRIKVEADKSGTRSKCMALVIQHVYSATHTLD